MDQPLRRHEPDPRRLAEAGDDPVAGEIAPQLRHRAEDHVGIGRPDHRAVDDPLDPRLADRRHPGHGAQHVLLDPLEIVGEKIMREIERRALLGPEPHVALIGPDQQALALLPQVIFAVAIRDRGQAAVHPGDLGIVSVTKYWCSVGCSGSSIPASRATSRPQSPAALITHGVRMSPLGVSTIHDPSGCGTRRRHRGEPMDLRAARPRADGIGIGHARGVHIAAIGLPHDAADAVEIHQRVQPLGLVAGNLVEIHAVEPRLGRLQPQLMHAVRSARGRASRAGTPRSSARSRPPAPCRGSSCNAGAARYWRCRAARGYWPPRAR